MARKHWCAAVALLALALPPGAWTAENLSKKQAATWESSTTAKVTLNACPPLVKRAAKRLALGRHRNSDGTYTIPRTAVGESKSQPVKLPPAQKTDAKR